MRLLASRFGHSHFKDDTAKAWLIFTTVPVHIPHVYNVDLENYRQNSTLRNGIRVALSLHAVK